MSDDEIQGFVRDLIESMDFARRSKEQADRHRTEVQAILIDLLEISDALENLTTHCTQLERQGYKRMPTRSVNTIAQRLTQVLAERGVHPMEAQGSNLELDRHEVVGTSSIPGTDPDSIIEVIQMGYLWSGNVLRQARVIIAKPAEPDSIPAREE